MNSSATGLGPVDAASGRLLVLQVTTNVDAKMLRTADVSSNQPISIALCDDWIQTDVKQGDIVRVVLTDEFGAYQDWHSSLSQPNLPLIISNDLNFFIHHPDTLVSGTVIAESFICLRKAVLSLRSPSGRIDSSAMTSQAALFGNLIHDMFQIILAIDSSTRDYSSPQNLSQIGGVDEESFFQTVEEVLHHNQESLYAANVLNQSARQVLHKIIPDISDWYKVVMGSGNYRNTNGALLRDGKSSHRVVVKEVHDIEELIWSPVLGLKGKIDASIQFRVDGADVGIGVFELKTGNSMGSSGVAHNAQTALYTLLMSDRNNRYVNHGLLTYVRYQEALKSVLHDAETDASPNESLGLQKNRADPQGTQKNRVIIPNRQEIVGLLMQRNRLASFLRPETAIDSLPTFLQGHEPLCAKCFANGSCMMQYKLLEKYSFQELSQGPGIDLFRKKTSHLSKEHGEYYRFWRSVLADEEELAGRKSRYIWSMEGSKRECDGGCISSLMLMPSDNGMESSPHELLTPGKTVLVTFKRHPRATLSGDLTKAGVSKNAYVIVSAENKITDKRGFSRRYNSTATWQCGLSTGFVSHINSKTISVFVDRSLSAWMFHQGLNSLEVCWRIDCEEMYGTHRTSKRTLENLFCDVDNEKATKLRELIVDGKRPKFGFNNRIADSDLRMNTKRTLSGYNLSLNDDQIRAVDMSLRAEDYALILGMPGTGKTTTLAAIILAFVSKGKSVLFCSHTNTAVDNLLLKLQSHNFNNFVRLGRKLDVIDRRLHENHISKILNPMADVSKLEAELTSRQVIATTCLGINHAVLARRTSSDLVVIDEASQILQPICIGPLQFAAGPFILVGDHYQLPPLQRSSGMSMRSSQVGSVDENSQKPQSTDSAQEASSSQFKTENESLFRRLCMRHPEAMVMLSKQYRMAGEIMSLSNELVYGGSLECGSPAVESQKLNVSAEGIRNLSSWLRAVRDSSKTIIFLDTGSNQNCEDRSRAALEQHHEHHRSRAGDNTERENVREVDAIIESVWSLMEGGTPIKDIAILSPYRAQVHLLQETFSGNIRIGKDAAENLQFFTVDQYQGRENKCVIVSFVRSRLSRVGPLLQDWRRINVALTRAKQKLILVGCSETLSGGSFFMQKMISWFRDRNLIFKVPESTRQTS